MSDITLITALLIDFLNIISLTIKTDAWRIDFLIHTLRGGLRFGKVCQQIISHSFRSRASCTVPRSSSRIAMSLNNSRPVSDPAVVASVYSLKVIEGTRQYPLYGIVE